MKSIVRFAFFLMLLSGCKERYTPPVTSPVTGYLVVEGFINKGPEPTTIKLTRTTKLIDTANIIYEHGAQVTVEGDNGESYPLPESGTGVYTAAPAVLNDAIQYRLHIVTANGNEYLSDYSAVKRTPPIDSISRARESGGVQIYINTHDPQNNTKYYQWEYAETWEIHSAFHSSLVYTVDPLTNQINGLDYRLPDSQQDDTTIYKCWKSGYSTSIIIGSSEKLTTDRIHLPLTYIGKDAEQLSVLYRIIVKQHAVSSGNYGFLQRIKKNTEQLGGIFDAQPSELKGNIHCVNNPAEPVIGYIDVSQLQEQQLFISNADLPDWNYTQPCGEIKIVNNPDSIRAFGTGLFPTSIAEYQFRIISFFASEPSCVDCTLRGTNVRPDFWP